MIYRIISQLVGREPHPGLSHLHVYCSGRTNSLEHICILVFFFTFSFVRFASEIGIFNPEYRSGKIRVYTHNRAGIRRIKQDLHDITDVPEHRLEVLLVNKKQGKFTETCRPGEFLLTTPTGNDSHNGYSLGMYVQAERNGG